MPTPHISAQVGDFAPVVLMPGDPLRAQMIARTYLDEVRQVTAVRNMYGFTGRYRGRPISVMGHGMGIPSCSIYATELIKEYAVKTIIRVGSCGAIDKTLNLRDIVIAMAASTDSQVNRMRFLGHDFAAIADYSVLQLAVEKTRATGKPVRVGNVFSTDLFYSVEPQIMSVWTQMKILAVEMELAGLYAVAVQYGCRALGLLTVSDILADGTAMSPDERETGFSEMVEIALETALDCAELD